MLRAAFLMVAAVALSACGLTDGDTAAKPAENLTPPFLGVVAADEPRAVMIGEEVLKNGGSAADAVTAMTFAMTVTQPSRASLGSGGGCVVFQPFTGEDEDEVEAKAILFPAIQTDDGGLVPGLVRGMAALQARYGRRRWSQLLAPAESMAHLGHKVSRAFARDLAEGAQRLARDPAAAAIYLKPDGRPYAAGETLIQAHLGEVLAGVRSQGMRYFYVDPFPETFAEAATRAGSAMTAAQVRGHRAAITDPIQVDVGFSEAYMLPPPMTGGVEAAQLWTMIWEVEDYEGDDLIVSPHLLAEAAERAFVARAAWRNPNGTSRMELSRLLDEDFAEELMASYDEDAHRPNPGGEGVAGLRPGASESASIVATDVRGRTVACSIGLGRLFGTGKVAPGTGILMAAPSETTDPGHPITPIVFGNENTGAMFFAAAAGGGDAAIVPLVRALAQVAEEDRPLSDIIADGRHAHLGYPDRVWAERTLARESELSLERRGHRIETVPVLGIINGFFCEDDVVDGPESCQAVADPRGFGLGIRVE